MSEIVILGLGSIGLILLGWAVLWLRSRISQTAAVRDQRVPMPVLRSLGWTLFGLGVLGAVVAMTQGLALVFGVLALVVLAAAARRYLETERQSLLWVLMAAAERGIPLDSAARAFADERHDMVGTRARNLADYLEAGLPLGLALKRSRHDVSSAALLAADLGSHTGTLGPALRQVVGQIDDLDTTIRTILEKYFYLVCVLFFALAMLAFLMLKIVPAWEKILADFSTPVPGATHALIGICRSLGNDGYVLLLPILAAILLTVVVGVRYYVRFSPRDLPWVRCLWRRADCALVIRWLAIAVRRNQPMAEMIRLLAAYFPRAGLRRRLEQAAVQIEGGGDWCDSLRRVQLLRREECAVFQAAQLAGNLAWTLDEMADSSVRRLAFRLQRWLSVLFPAVVLVFGGCVLFIALALLGPLFGLIDGLS